MADVKIGEIIHYYNKIGVAVLKLTKGDLSSGETIRIAGHGKEFTQVVSSMQVEHQQIEKAVKDQELGMKVDQEVHERDEVFKVTV